VATKTKTALVVLAVAVAIVLGRWPVHWHAHPVLAAVSAVVVAAVVGGLLSVRTARAALPAAALLCLVDAFLLVRRWSVHLPIHCSCLPKSGGAAILGVGGLSFLVDLALAGSAFWISRGWRRS
jgi:hypothetical protein